METSSSADGSVATPSWPSRPKGEEVSFYSFKPTVVCHGENPPPSRGGLTEALGVEKRKLIFVVVRRASSSQSSSGLGMLNKGLGAVLHAG
jgi:hypothetical protein